MGWFKINLYIVRVFRQQKLVPLNGLKDSGTSFQHCCLVRTHTHTADTHTHTQGRPKKQVLDRTNELIKIGPGYSHNDVILIFLKTKLDKIYDLSLAV